MGHESFTGKINGCDAVVTVRDDAVILALELPWAKIDAARVVGNGLMIRQGPIMIQFQSPDAATAIEAMRGLLDPKVLETKEPIRPASLSRRSRWRRKR